MGVNDDDLEKTNRDAEEYTPDSKIVVQSRLTSKSPSNLKLKSSEEDHNYNISKYSKVKSKNKFKLILSKDNTIQTRVKKIEFKNELENTIQPNSILTNPTSPDINHDKVILRESKFLSLIFSTYQFQL